MIKYYYNPKSEDLCIFDQSSGNLFILERIKSVRVVVENDVQADDMGQDRHEMVGSKHRFKDDSGSDNKSKRAKITPEMIEEMKERKNNGESITEIAQSMGVSNATVFNKTKLPK